MGKKLGFGLLGLLVAGAIYYFTIGSSILASEMQKQVNSELLQASTHGFKVEEHNVKQMKEHFTLTLDNPEKITHFLETRGILVQKSDIETLTGLKLGVDIAYLSDAYSAVSIDLYPLTLPTQLTAVNLEPKDKKILTQFTTMLTNKALLVHVDVNKLGTGFKGYIQDINETINDDFMTNVSLQGLTFEGSVNAHKLEKITQNLKALHLLLDEKVSISLQGMQSHYLLTGKTKYDYSSSYSIDTIQVQDNNHSSLSLQDTQISSISVVQDNLMTASIISNTKSIHIKDKEKTFTLDTLKLNTKTSNLDILAFEKLQEVDAQNQEALNTVMQQLVSKGVRIDIQNISAQNISYEDKKLDDFNLTAYLDIDKSLNITALQQNPLLAISAIDANLKLTLAPALFKFISEQPKAMLMLMLFQPQDINGKKVYSAELKDGKLTVNGMPVM